LIGFFLPVFVITWERTSIEVLIVLLDLLLCLHKIIDCQSHQIYIIYLLALSLVWLLLVGKPFQNGFYFYLFWSIGCFTIHSQWHIRRWSCCILLCWLLIPANPLVIWFFIRSDLYLCCFFGIIKGIGYKLVLLVLGIGPSVWKFTIFLDPCLEFLHLCKIITTYFQSFLLVIDEFQWFIQGPTVLLHEVGNEYCWGSGFAMEGVDKATLALLHRLLNECIDGIHCIILLIEYLSEF
jgi:hypothetical protein